MKRNTTARLQSADSQTKRFGIEMLTPTMIILIIMTAYPLIFTLIYSFTDYNYLKGTDKASFILFKNYIKLFKNDYFRQAVLNTIKRRSLITKNGVVYTPLFYPSIQLIISLFLL